MAQARREIFLGTAQLIVSINSDNMIPISWSESVAIPDLPELQKKQRALGGYIILFMRVTSYVVLSKTVELPQWVGPKESRFLRGIRASWHTIAFGWWSLPGILGTVHALIYNLSGGCDVTELYSDPPVVNGSPEHSAVITRIKQCQKKVESRLSWILLIVILTVVVWAGWKIATTDA